MASNSKEAANAQFKKTQRAQEGAQGRAQYETDVGLLSNEIVGSQHHGSIGLGLLFEELTRCSLFNYFAQPHKLIYTLIWFNVTPTFKIVHRRGADRARDYLALIEHRELNDHPIEVIALYLASLQRHCKFSMLDGFHYATSIGRCQSSSDEQTSVRATARYLRC